jgi:hypothetical protein
MLVKDHCTPDHPKGSRVPSICLSSLKVCKYKQYLLIELMSMANKLPCYEIDEPRRDKIQLHVQIANQTAKSGIMVRPIY